mgnify:FL=1
MSLLTIDGIEMPQPSQYSFPMSDIIGDDTYNEDGTLFRDRIRQGICTIDVAWTANAQQAAILLNAIIPDTVEVKYLDPRVNGYRTAKMCVSDRSCELVMFDGDESNSNLWSISFSLTQY